MKFVLTLALMFGIFCAQAGSLNVEKKTTVANPGMATGILKLSSPPPAGGMWYHVNFLDEKGEVITSFRFDEEKMIHDQGHCVFDKKLGSGDKMNVEIQLSAVNNFCVLLGGKIICSTAGKSGKAVKSIVIEPVGCSVAFDDVQWTDKSDVKKTAFVVSPGDVVTTNVLGDIVPEDDFEFTCRFYPQKLADSVFHYGIRFDSKKASEAGIQFVFWEKFFQMIQGKTDKKLGDFNADFANKWHEFKVKKTYGDFFEIFIDGKAQGSFTADFSGGGRIAIWTYRNWALTLEDISMVKLEETD